MSTATSGPSAINFLLKYNLAAVVADSPLERHFYVNAKTLSTSLFLNIDLFFINVLMKIWRFLLKASCSLSPQTHTRLFRSHMHSPKDRTYQALKQSSWSCNDNHQLLHKLGNEGNLGALGSLVGLWRAEHHLMVLAVNSSFLYVSCWTRRNHQFSNHNSAPKAWLSQGRQWSQLIQGCQVTYSFSITTDSFYHARDISKALFALYHLSVILDTMCFYFIFKNEKRNTDFFNFTFHTILTSR